MAQRFVQNVIANLFWTAPLGRGQLLVCVCVNLAFLVCVCAFGK